MKTRAHKLNSISISVYQKNESNPAPRIHRIAHGFSAGSQTHGTELQSGQPCPYLRKTAASRSIPRIFASVASHASTSAISAADTADYPNEAPWSTCSPNSSVNHRNVAASPRAASFCPYICKIIRCNADSVKTLEDRDGSLIDNILPGQSAGPRGGNYLRHATGISRPYGPDELTAQPERNNREQAPSRSASIQASQERAPTFGSGTCDSGLAELRINGGNVALPPSSADAQWDKMAAFSGFS